MAWFARFAAGRRTFVETGTFRGDGIYRALEDFQNVISIEIDPALYAKACKRFDGEPRVTILNGDSAKLLPNVCKTLSEPACFYLDAHWSGQGPKTLLAELRTIAQRDHTDVVVIDDARLLEAGFDALSAVCPGDYEWTSDIDRLVIYR